VHWLLLGILSLSLQAEDLHVEPQSIKQGQTLKVFGDKESREARLDGRTIRLFEQPEGYSMGLMPIDVLAKPGVYQLEWLDVHGTPIQQVRIVILNAHYRKQNVVLTPALARLKSTSDERERVAAFLKELSPARYWEEPLEAPLPGCITSPFGVTRFHNGKPTGEYHAGLDQRGAFGSPIHAVAGGVVKIAQQFTLRGGTVGIDHGQGLESIYLHMSRFAAKEGEQVHKGDVIGYVGSTGRSTGPHVHWTLYVNSEPVNPLQWIHDLTSCTNAAGTPHLKRPMSR
jgi:murein DD-endopeptidase MepM/ murein hydrolase activator NlpD